MGNIKRKIREKNNNRKILLTNRKKKMHKKIAIMRSWKMIAEKNKAIREKEKIGRKRKEIEEKTTKNMGLIKLARKAPIETHIDREYEKKKYMQKQKREK